MTESELQSLPDVTPSFSVREEVRDGRKVMIPVQIAECGALFQRPEDGVFDDADGVSWMTGWQDGQRVRRRMA